MEDLRQMTINELEELFAGLEAYKEYNKLTFSQRVELLDLITDLDRLTYQWYPILYKDVGGE